MSYATRNLVERGGDVTARRLDRTMLELRERGLAFPAIAVVMDLYEGVALTERQVRTRLDKLGAPKNPNKARPRHDRVEDASWPYLEGVEA